MFSDFDGTLAPIVDDPDTARPLEGVVDALEAVARRVDRVGVISGRPASFLIQHLGGRGFSLWGMYGLESVEDDAEGHARVVPSPEVDDWRAAIDEVTERAEQELGETLGVERKGLSVTLHYRRAPGKADVARDWADAAAESSGLIAHRAKMSYELRPPLSSDKGTVLEEAASGLERACFFGDDLGDLEAFDALDRLATRGVTVLRVGVRSREAPEELLDRADLVVDGPQGVLEVLRALVDG